MPIDLIDDSHSRYRDNSVRLAGFLRGSFEDLNLLKIPATRGLENKANVDFSSLFYKVTLLCAVQIKIIR